MPHSHPWDPGLDCLCWQTLSSSALPFFKSGRFPLELSLKSRKEIKYPSGEGLY